MTDRIAISIQITEAVEAWGERKREALRRGPGQSMAQLRANAAGAIVDTLRWCAENEADIREWQAAKREGTA
jgi:hypothetical protein